MIMLNEMNLLVLDKAMDNFNGVMLYLEELSKTTNFILRYDFYITEVGIEVWTSMKENVAGAMWFADEYED